MSQQIPSIFQLSPQCRNNKRFHYTQILYVLGINSSCRYFTEYLPSIASFFPWVGGLWNIWYFCFSILEYNRATTIVGYSCSRCQKVSVRTSWIQILISESQGQQRRVRAHMHIFRPHIHSFHGRMLQINNTYIIFHLKRCPLFISTGCSLQTLVPCGAGWWAQSPTPN